MTQTRYFNVFPPLRHLFRQCLTNNSSCSAMINFVIRCSCLIAYLTQFKQFPPRKSKDNTARLRNRGCHHRKFWCCLLYKCIYPPQHQRSFKRIGYRVFSHFTESISYTWVVIESVFAVRRIRGEIFIISFSLVHSYKLKLSKRMAFVLILLMRCNHQQEHQNHSHQLFPTGAIATMYLNNPQQTPIPVPILTSLVCAR